MNEMRNANRGHQQQGRPDGRKDKWLVGWKYRSNSIRRGKSFLKWRNPTRPIAFNQKGKYKDNQHPEEEREERGREYI